MQRSCNRLAARIARADGVSSVSKLVEESTSSANSLVVAAEVQVRIESACSQFEELDRGK